MYSAPFSGAILAGGRARRFGGIDKGGLLVGAASVLDRQISALRAITPDILIIGGNPPRNQFPGLRVAADRIAGAGALGGLYTALCEASTDHVIVLACDMPFVTAPFLNRLAALGTEYDVAVPRNDRGWHPLCACYARRAAAHLRARLEQGRLRVIEALEGLAIREVTADELASFDSDGSLLLNVNTPDDYARARAVCDARRSTASASDQVNATSRQSSATT